MLIDVHAHFYSERSLRSDWRSVNAARLEAGRKIGITEHVASILGTYGARSPTYFPSPEDVTHANDALLNMIDENVAIHGYCVVNPNFTDHALNEITARAESGMIGVKLAASRRADDELLDPIAELAGRLRLPILHHVWQDRRRDWPEQEASDASELADLAARHPATRFVLAHLGGGGDWAHSLRVLSDIGNIWVDLSGSGVDTDMLDRAVDTLGCGRLLWGSDITIDTAWAKLRYLKAMGLSETDMDLVRSGNARRIFPQGAFGAHN
jgi:predicted TIM-barrel fold metal-dependent hydrolase